MGALADLWNATVGTIEEIPGVVRDEALTAVGEKPVIDDLAADVGRGVNRGAKQVGKTVETTVGGAFSIVAFLARHLVAIVILLVIGAAAFVVAIYGRPLLALLKGGK